MTVSGELKGIRALKWNLLGLALILLALPVLGQSDAQRPQRTERYEGGAGDNEITEAAFRLTGLDPKQRERVAIRVCSKEPIVRALASAPANPFEIADRVSGYAYLPEKVLFLRSAQCLSRKNPAITATEIWAIPEGAPLPGYEEILTSNQVKLVRLGKIPAPSNRGIRDYRPAVRDLIENLSRNPQNVGIVFGYFLEHPSPALKRRIREVTKSLEQSGLPSKRYLVRLTYWPDEVSTYPPDSEPQYPSVFLVEMGPQGQTEVNVVVMGEMQLRLTTSVFHSAWLPRNPAPTQTQD
ncbi:MAG TPA: hypothetical protein VK582_02365 [Pyrinomonadaceae bacterium]|nr:hypothetical protein [Pyrinomonadaceae bacterium]